MKPRPVRVSKTGRTRAKGVSKFLPEQWVMLGGIACAIADAQATPDGLATVSWPANDLALLGRDLARIVSGEDARLVLGQTAELGHPVHLEEWWARTIRYWVGRADGENHKEAMQAGLRVRSGPRTQRPESLRKYKSKWQARAIATIELLGGGLDETGNVIWTGRRRDLSHLKRKQRPRRDDRAG